MIRHKTAVVLMAVLACTGTLVPFAAAQTTQSQTPVVSETTTQLTTGWGGLVVNTDSQIVEYEAGGQARPSWVVGFENGSYGAVADWAASSESRRLLRADNRSNTALLAAPPADMGLTILSNLPLVGGGSLSDREYVRSLEVNYEIGTDPVRLRPESQAFDPPAPDASVVGAWDQTGVAYLDAPRATPADVREVLGHHNTTVTGEGVTIGIIDTGISTADGAVFGNGTRGSQLRIAAAKNFVEPSRPTGLSAVEDGSGHGTWVASAVAANTTDPEFDGGLPDASLAIAKALGDDGSGETADIAAAVRWQEQQNVPIIGMSLGSPMYSEEIANALRDYLAGNGTLAMVATGNSRQNPATRYLASPSDVPEAGVVAVGATTAERPQNASSAYFSQVSPNAAGRDGSPSAAGGQQVDLAGPGMNLTVRAPTTGGSVGNSTKSGTSMAQPWVTTAVGATLAANPSLRNDTAGLRERVLEAARPVPNAGETEVGHGMAAADLAVAGETPGTEQSAARTGAAEARDAANRAYAGDGQGFIADMADGLNNLVSGASGLLPAV